VLAWHAEAVRIGRAQRIPMVILQPADAVEAVAPLATDAKGDPLAEARRRFATN